MYCVCCAYVRLNSRSFFLPFLLLPSLSLFPFFILSSNRLLLLSKHIPFIATAKNCWKRIKRQQHEKAYKNKINKEIGQTVLFFSFSYWMYACCFHFETFKLLTIRYTTITIHKIDFEHCQQTHNTTAIAIQKQYHENRRVATRAIAVVP